MNYFGAVWNIVEKGLYSYDYRWASTYFISSGIDKESWYVNRKTRILIIYLIF